MIIHKVPSLDLAYNWLCLPFTKDSNYKKIEIYTNASINQKFIDDFIQLFNFDFKNIVVGPCMIGLTWEDFATEYDNELIEYNNIYETNFVKMLKSNNIPLDYNGYCGLQNWKEFLNLLVEVIDNVNGTDSLKFYNINGKYAFYPFPPNSFGLYYENINNEIQIIIDRSIRLGWDVKYYPELPQ